MDNLYEFHFVVEGAPETDYEGGFYHGMLRFPPEYPMWVSAGRFGHVALADHF
jgi:ubiquitin-protein ligase